MEEKKNVKNLKTIKKKQYTYEELNGICSELFQQNQNLMQQLRQQNMANMFKRLDYLFQVLHYASVFKDEEFVANCAEEIKNALTISEDVHPEDGESTAAVQ